MLRVEVECEGCGLRASPSEKRIEELQIILWDNSRDYKKTFDIQLCADCRVRLESGVSRLLKEGKAQL